MKKLLGILMILILIAGVFVSCSQDKIEEAAISGEELLDVSFDASSGRARDLVVDTPVFDDGDYVWYYTAKKADSTGFKTGETLVKTPVKDPAAAQSVADRKGLSGAVISGLSQGYWDFGLYAYVPDTSNSGTYTSDNYALYVFSSGGQITVKGGTFSGDKDGIAIVAAMDGETYPGYEGAVSISGGNFSGGYSITAPASMIITGGTFVLDPSAYVPAGYLVKEIEGGYEVVPLTLVKAVDATCSTTGTHTYWKDSYENKYIVDEYNNTIRVATEADSRCSWQPMKTQRMHRQITIKGLVFSNPLSSNLRCCTRIKHNILFSVCKYCF